MIKCNTCLNLATSICSNNQAYICENCIKTEDSCEFSKSPGTHPPVAYSLNSENLFQLRIQISKRLKILNDYKEDLMKTTQKLITCLIKSHKKIIKMLDKKEDDLKNMQKKDCLSVDEYQQANDLFLKEFHIKRIDYKKIYEDIKNQYNTCKVSEPYIVDDSTVERVKQKYLQKLNILGTKSLKPQLVEVSTNKSIIFLGVKNTIQAYSLNDFSSLYEFKENNYSVTCLKLSKCNNFIVSGHANGMAILWNIKNQCLDKIFSDSKKQVLYVTISIDCSYIVLISKNSVKLLDIQKNKLIGGFESECICSSISPDSRNILFSLSNFKILVFDMETQKSKGIFNKHSSIATSLLITNDNLRALSRSENEIIIWNIANTKTIKQVTCINILSLDISIDSSYFVFGLSDNKVILWDIKAKKAIKITETSSPVIFVSFFNNEKKILSASVDGIISVISTSNFIKDLLFDTKSKIISIQITLDKKHLVSSYENQIFSVFDLKKLSLTSQITFEKPISSICLSCTKTFLAIGSSDGTLSIYSIQEKKPTTVLKKHQGSVNCLAISFDDSLIVSGSSDSSIVIWNIFDENDNDCLIGHNSEVNCLAITNDNRMIISGSEDQSFIVWGLLDRKIRYVYSGFEFPIKKLVIGTEMRFVYIPCAFGVVKVLDLLENTEIQDVVLYDWDTVKKVLSLYPESQSFFREAFIFKL